jgi:hypothetical protein
MVRFIKGKLLLQMSDRNPTILIQSVFAKSKYQVLTPTAFVHNLVLEQQNLDKQQRLQSLQPLQPPLPQQKRLQQPEQLQLLLLTLLIA